MNDPMFGPIDQIGYVVGDLDRSIARWRERHDVGPWTVATCASTASISANP
ncbi:hypothetical protein [Burkholderia contaminans]|uniref:hypothetical protein n=1 Tax=Burkholderia contaminans TaxID=488447 RepID=UPI0021AB96FA|nr:hypothetical protein [Burkholderia contaminans]